MNLKTSATVEVGKKKKKKKKKKEKSSQNKMTQNRAERNVFGPLTLFSVQHDFDLELTLSFPIGLLP